MKACAGKASRKFIVTAAAVFAMSLVTSSGVATLPESSSGTASAAELVSAVGNTIQVENATFYPWGYYTTEAKCRARAREIIASRPPGTFYGSVCTLQRSGPQKGKWKLEMGEHDCTDRVLKAAGIGASLRRDLL